MSLLSLIPLRAWAAMLVAALIAAAGSWVAWQHHALADARIRLARATTALQACQSTQTRWQAAYRALERRRADDQRSAIQSAGDEAGACEARIARARQSTGAISGLLSRAPPVDGRGCPVREIMQGSDLDAALPQP